MLEQLKVEEGFAREQLDAKIQFEQDMELLTEEADAVEKKRAENREELLRMEIRFSQLKTANAKHKDDLEKITVANESLIKKNTELDEKNTKLDAEIVALIKRIDVNSLLKEVDMEELKLLAQNTENMNMAFMNMLNRWDTIKKDDTA